MANKAFYHALLGQNEMAIISRLGAPTNIVASLNGGKIFIYEYYTKGMFEMKGGGESIDGLEIFNNKTGAVYDIRLYPENSNSRNLSYQKNVNSLFVFLDPNGKCYRFEQDLPKEKLEFYYERLKTYIPENKLGQFRMDNQ
jgi:hypothetical protein